MDIEAVLRLIQIQGTLEQVGEYLKAKELEHSASSWREMIERRIRPRLNSGDISAEDLLWLLRDTEENGNQHVLLYDLVPGKSVGFLFDENLEARLSNLAGFPAIAAPKVVEMPESPEIVEIREEILDFEKVIIIKIVEQRLSRRRTSTETRGSQYVVYYNQEPYRAVNIVRIYERGFAEVRIFSHQEAVSYTGQAEGILKKISALCPSSYWRPFYLNTVKNAFWSVESRDTIKAHFGLRHSQHRNADGNKLSAAVIDPQMSMFDDESLLKGIDGFNSGQNGVECDRASITVKPGNGALRPINVVLHGDNNGSPNEFSIGSRVTRAEYEHVLNTILMFNRP